VVGFRSSIRNIDLVFLSSEDKLWQYISGISVDEGLSLYDLEKCSGDLLKVSLLKEDSSSPTVGDCSRLAKRLKTSLFAEAEDLGLGDDIELDVSSPGLDRRLRTEEHFQLAIGREIKATCSDKAVLGGVVQGILTSCDSGRITLEPGAESSKPKKRKGKSKKKRKVSAEISEGTEEQKESSEVSVETSTAEGDVSLDMSVSLQMSDIIKANLVFSI